MEVSRRLPLARSQTSQTRNETRWPVWKRCVTAVVPRRIKANCCSSLAQLIKLHERSDLPHLLWLDKLAYRQIEKVHAEESLQSDEIYLYIDLPRFETPIVYCEQESSSLPPSVSTSVQTSQGGPSYADTTTATSASRGIDASLFTIYDGDMLMERENPVEAKHRRLVRSHRSGPLDRELKPNAGVRDELNVCDFWGGEINKRADTLVPLCSLARTFFPTHPHDR